MTTYFGFKPTQELQEQIAETVDIVENQVKTDYYVYRDKITKQVAHEIVDNLLSQLVSFIEDPNRKKRLEKVIHTIHGAIDTLLKHVLTKLPNEKAIDSFDFLQNKSVFTDSNGDFKVGFALSDEQIEKIKAHFQQADDNADAPHKYLQVVVEVIIDGNLEHFLKDFSKTLHLGMLKRGAIPIAEKAISTAAHIAVHKIMPDMPLEAATRLKEHYKSLIVEG